MKILFKFICILDTAEERICELEDVSIEIFKTKRRRERERERKAWKRKNQKKIPKNCGATTKSIT